MKPAAVKFKTKQTEVVSTYKVILCSGKISLGCGSAIPLSGWETRASSQKKNALIMNKIKANNIYLLTFYKWQETRGPSGEGLYYTSWPYALLFLVTVRKEQCSYTIKINYVSGTPQPFCELTQPTYLEKVDLLGRWGHRGAGLVLWLFSKLNWITKTSSKCWRWYKRGQEYASPFAWQPVFRSV